VVSLRETSGRFRLLLRSAGDAFCSAVFPAPCRICGATLDFAGRLPVCLECLSSFTELAAPLCSLCGRPILSLHVSESATILCRLCRSETYDFDIARSYAFYDPPMVRAILLLKHGGVPPLGAWFARKVAEVVARDAAAFDADLIVPVPLHRARRRERGYNQAELIALPLARQLGVPARNNILLRSRPRPGVLRLTRSQRWSAAKGAFATRPGAQVDKLRVLLVDDVMTTGATLDACSRVLRRAGAARVMALTVARTPAHSAQVPVFTSSAEPQR
jgi:ComF family protein